MDYLEQRIRDRVNDAPMATEHLLDEVADRLRAYREALAIAMPWLEGIEASCGYSKCTPENCQAARARVDLKKVNALMNG